MLNFMALYSNVLSSRQFTCPADVVLNPIFIP